MGGLAQLARAQGYRVTGSDTNVYPPMSTQLNAAGIDLWEGYSLEQLNPLPDLVVIGNALSRGNPVVEAVLERGIPYSSGPQWLGRGTARREVGFSGVRNAWKDHNNQYARVVVGLCWHAARIPGGRCAVKF